MTKDEQLLKKCNTFWNKVININNTEFDTEPVYNKKYLKTKVKSYNGKISARFHGDKTPEEGSHYVCISVMITESVFKMGNDYYPQVYLEEWK